MAFSPLFWLLGDSLLSSNNDEMRDHLPRWLAVRFEQQLQGEITGPGHSRQQEGKQRREEGGLATTRGGSADLSLPL